MSKEVYKTKLIKYTNEKGAEFITDLFFEEQILSLVITKSRSSKLGDYRPPQGRKRYHQITVNHDLGKMTFFLTLVHEYAHYQVWNKWGGKVKPHGEEWRSCLRKHLRNAIEYGVFSAHDRKAVISHFFEKDTIATGYCPGLEQATDLPELPLTALPENSYFAVERRVFQKKEKLRSRYRCVDMANKKTYRIHGDTPIVITFTAEELIELGYKL